MSVTLLTGDALAMLRTLPSDSVHCVVTSPPYWGLRDYGVAGQIGLEQSLGQHIDALVGVFREVRRVLRKDGTVWLNYGDAYACAPNGRSAADIKAAGNDDRTFRDKPISTVEPVRKSYRRDGEAVLPEARGASGLKPKDRMLLPARIAIALQEDGWWVRDEIIWHKPNPMPSSVKDRTTPAHEMVYLLSKSERYAYDHAAIREPAAVKDWEDGSRVYGGVNKAGANAKHGERTTGRRTSKLKVPGGWDKGEGGHGTIHRDGRTEATYVEAEPNPTRQKRSVWTVAPRPFTDAHFATFPPDLIRPMILAGCPAGGTVLDPFGGAGTTGLVAQELGRNAILIELSEAYCDIIRRRLNLPDIPTFEEMVA